MERTEEEETRQKVDFHMAQSLESRIDNQKTKTKYSQHTFFIYIRLILMNYSIVYPMKMGHKNQLTNKKYVEQNFASTRIILYSGRCMPSSTLKDLIIDCVCCG